MRNSVLIRLSSVIGRAIRQLLKDAEAQKEELLVSACLASLGAFVFSVFRPNPGIPTLWGGFSIGLGLIIAVVWVRRFGRKLEPIAGFVWGWKDIFAGLSFGLVSLVLFLPLMRLHFDTGTDTSVALGVDEIWSSHWAAINRPIVGLGAYLALKLTPGSIDGFFVVILLGRTISALALYYLVRALAPTTGRSTAAIAGILFIMNPAVSSPLVMYQ